MDGRMDDADGTEKSADYVEYVRDDSWRLRPDSPG